MIGYQSDASGNRIAKGTITSMNCDLTANGFAVSSEYVLTDGSPDTEVVWANGTSAWSHTNVRASGALIGTYDLAGLHLYVNDPVGSRRVPD